MKFWKIIGLVALTSEVNGRRHLDQGILTPKRESVSSNTQNTNEAVGT